MKLITEINEDVQYLTEAEENGKKDYMIRGVFMQGGIKNRNGRVYPVEVLAKEVDRYNQEYISKNRAYGELGHPQGPTINLDRVSHIIKELKQDGNNFMGTAKILDTPMGNIVKNFIDEGAGLGVSSRGMGTLKNGKGVAEVQDDFYLATAADIVADPSAPDAFVEGIMEGKEWIWENGLMKEVSVSELHDEIKEATTRNLDEVKLRVFRRFMENLRKL